MGDRSGSDGCTVVGGETELLAGSGVSGTGGGTSL